MKLGKPQPEKASGGYFDPKMMWRCDACETLNYRHWEHCPGCGKRRPASITSAS